MVLRGDIGKIRRHRREQSRRLDLGLGRMQAEGVAKKHSSLTRNPRTSQTGGCVASAKASPGQREQEVMGNVVCVMLASSVMSSINKIIVAPRVNE